MLPLSDGLKAHRFPIVNVSLIVANFAVWIFYELPHLNQSIYHASFYLCSVNGSCRSPDPWGYQLDHGDVQARRAGPSSRQGISRTSRPHRPGT